LQADVGVAHLAFDLGAGDKGGDGVDDDDVHGAGADEGVGDFQGLLAGVGLGDVEVIDVDAALGGVGGVEGVLHVDVGADAAELLGFGDDVLAEGGLAGGFGAVDFDDTAARHAAHAQRDVERDGAGGNGLDVQMWPRPGA
jgi:hypothetical protein